MTEEIEILGRRYPVTVHQHKKTVWTATGDDANGKYLQVKGRTEGQARRKWHTAVKYQLNDRPIPPVNSN